MGVSLTLDAARRRDGRKERKRGKKGEKGKIERERKLGKKKRKVKKSFIEERGAEQSGQVPPKGTHVGK